MHTNRQTTNNEHTAQQPWYTRDFRRYLCDMHIESWDKSFLSEFTAEQYFENVVATKAQTAVIYLQSHVGCCYFPTKSGLMHEAYQGREDTTKRLIDMCRANGVHVVGYYSVIFNNRAYERHPDWRMIDANGRTHIENGNRYGLCCPNNPDYRAFVKEQITEIAQYFSLDGIYFDMLFWPHACYCPSCQKRWAEEVGGSIPTEPDASSEIWRKHIERRQVWMADFAQYIATVSRQLRPEWPVEMNLANVMLRDMRAANGWNSTLVNEWCDYAGGDLYGGLLEQSFACKFYKNISKTPPFEYMTSRCDPDLTRHTITKSDDKLTVATMIACAHHGAMLLIDAIDPVGTIDKRISDKIGRVFSVEAPYEPYLMGEMVEDAAIFFNSRGKDNLQNDVFSAHSGSIGAAKTLIEAHIPFGVISEANFDIEKHKFAILPYLNTISDEVRQRILSYVENGGCIYMSGAEEPALLKELLGAKKIGFTECAVTYLAPKEKYESLCLGYSRKYPIPFGYQLPILEGVDDDAIVATLALPYTRKDEERFASIHSDPPGIVTELPGIVIKKYGRGTVIWSAAPIEDETIHDYKQLFLRLIGTAVSRESLTVQSDAPACVELVSFKDRETDCVYMSAVHISEDDAILPVDAFTVRFKSEKPAKAVYLLPEKKPVPFTYSGGYVTFEARKLRIFDMYQITF